MNKILKPFFAVALVGVLFLLNISIVHAAEGDIVTFPDSNLNQALLDLGVDTSGDGEITEGEMGALVGTLDLSNNAIGDITGLEYLVGVTELQLSGNGITDLTALSSLVNLTSLDLSGNTSLRHLSPIGGLTNLTQLNISNTDPYWIMDIGGLVNLESLSIGSTDIEYINFVENMSNLKYLDISETKVDELDPLSEIDSLQELNISDSWINDLEPISLLPNIVYLDASFLNITTLDDLLSATSLQYLDISDSHITYYLSFDSLSSLTNLEWLDISNTDYFNNLDPIEGMSKLEYFDFSNCSVTDVTKLQSLQLLSNTNVSDNYLNPNDTIGDMAILSGLTANVINTGQKTQRIRYMEGGYGEVIRPSDNVYYGEMVTMPAVTADEGFIFVGWDTDDDEIVDLEDGATASFEKEYTPQDDYDLNITAIYERDFAWTSGSGTEQDPYLVSTPEQLYEVRYFDDSSFLMTNDIDLTDVISHGGVYYNDGDGWESILGFEGCFDGGGYRIIGLNASLCNGIAKDGCIKNLTIAESIITNGNAAFAGLNRGCIVGCTNESRVIGDNGKAAGIVSTNYGHISKCSNSGELSAGYGYIGGIVAYNYGVISDCYNRGTLSSSSDADMGGIAGMTNMWEKTCLIVNCYNAGSFDTSHTVPGGIVGDGIWGGVITDCYYLDCTLSEVGDHPGSFVSNNVRLSDAQMRMQESFPTLDFEFTWEMPNRGDYMYPVLRENMEKPASGPSNDFAGGIGTPEDPYQVTSPAHLNAVRFYPRSSFVLTQDIDLTMETSIGGEYYNNGDGWEPIGNEAYPVEGIFDGNGFKIIGMQIDRQNRMNLGLFGVVNGAQIKDLEVDVDILGSAYYVGGIVGRAEDSTITRCNIGGNIEVGYSSGRIGGITGFSSGTIELCYNKASIAATGSDQRTGGVTGENLSGVVSQSFNNGVVIAPKSGYVAGLAAYNYMGIISDCYNAGYVDGSGIVRDNNGTIARCYNAGMAYGINTHPKGFIDDCYYIEPEQIRQQEYGGMFVKTDLQMQNQSTFEQYNFTDVWTMNGNLDYPYPELIGNTHDLAPENIVEFSGGDGTEENPYQVSTPQQLDAVRFNRDNHFIMINDIDLTAAVSEGGEFYYDGLGWKSVCDDFPLYGSFDGQGYSITGLKSGLGGLFGTIGDKNNVGSCGLLTNTHVVDAEINTSRLTFGSGGILASSNFGKISYSSVSGYMNSSSSVGGVVNNNGYLVHHCYNLASLDGYHYAGGLVANNQETGIIQQCYNAGYVDAGTDAGGIASLNRGLIEDCFNIHDIHCTNGVAGIAQDNFGTVRRCFNTGYADSYWDSHGGAIAGDNQGTVDTCYFLDNNENAVYEGTGSVISTLSKTLGEMRQQATFNEFNFEDIWEISEGISPPTLQGVSYTYASGIELDIASLTMHFGENQALSATVSPQSATNKNVTWSTSDENIAIVVDGIVTAVSSGSTVITVTTEDGGYTDTCIVNVVVPVTGISLDQEALDLLVGESATLSETVLPSNAENKNVSWSSTNTGVVTVDGGIVTAQGPGTAAIEVLTEDGGYTAQCIVEVTQPVTGVSLNQSSLNMNLGSTAELSAIIEPQNASNKSVVWSSSNEGVATAIDGIVTAHDIGEAVITVTTVDGSYSAICTVAVECDVTGVSISESKLDLTVGMSSMLAATIAPSNATNQSIAWTSSNEGVALVDGNGNVSAISTGTSTITVTTEDGGYTAQCVVNVTQPVTGVSLNHSNLNINVGSTAELIPTVEPANASNKSVLWSSSNEDVATVVDGTVTAHSAGEAIITVTTDDGGYTAACTVNVLQKVTGVELNMTELMLAEGESDTLSISVLPSNAANKIVTWISSNTNVATVTNGTVSAVSEGTSVITVTTADGGFTDSCTVTVKSAQIESSVYSVDRQNGYLKGVDIDTSVSTLKSNLANDADDIKVYGSAGNEYTGALLRTGMTVRLVINSTVHDELNIVILGDASGDGYISITDYTLARLDILGLKALAGEFKEASDVNGDGVISITDYTLIRLDILGLKKIH